MPDRKSLGFQRVANRLHIGLVGGKAGMELSGRQIVAIFGGATRSLRF